MLINIKILCFGTLFFCVIFSLYNVDFSIDILNNIFLVGLFCFICGGTSLVINKGVFNNMFHSFKVFLKSTSKLERYAIEKEVTGLIKQTKPRKYVFINTLLVIGMFMMMISTVFSIFYIN